MSEVTLRIGETDWRGWTGVAISRALEEVAGRFELDVTDRWPDGGRGPAPRPIRPFEPCLLLIDDEPVIRGVIDEAAPSYDANSHTIRVSGRSLTGQLVDCSTELSGGQLRGQSLAAIAAKVAEPFGIEVVDLAEASEPFPRVQIEPGESAHDVLERLARQRGVFLTDDAEGRLVIRRRSNALQGRLALGGNVLAASGRLDGSAQFSSYQVRGQREGSDEADGAASARVSGRAADASVPIHRPLVLLSEMQGAAARLKERAEFEAALRRGRGRRWSYTLQGLRRPDGALWASSEEVEIDDVFMGFDAERLLVTELRFRLDAAGEITELTVSPPEGYDLIAERETVSGRAEAAGWPHSTARPAPAPAPAAVPPAPGSGPA